jgi:hypothetical protein
MGMIIAVPLICLVSRCNKHAGFINGECTEDVKKDMVISADPNGIRI